MFKSKDSNITLTSAEILIRDYQPPRFVIENVLQSNFITILTAQIGHGKTALLSYMAFCVALGLPFGGLKTHKGKVIYIAGENEVDVLQRLAAQAKILGFSSMPENLFVMTLKNSHEFLSSMDEFDVDPTLKGINLIVIDTAASVFDGDKEDCNVQQKRFASKIRTLFKKFDQSTAIVVACHPRKDAADRSSLKPRGGSSFYGEIDCATIAIRKESIITFEAAEKFRGKKFKPIHFQLIEVKCERILDIDGNPINSVAVNPVLSDPPIPFSRVGRPKKVIDPELIEKILTYMKTVNKAKLEQIISALNASVAGTSGEIDAYSKRQITDAVHEMKDRLILLRTKYFYSVPRSISGEEN